MVINRITTGIPKLDDQLEGGIPENSVVLVSGPAGSCKTLFGLQFLCQNGLQKRKGAYFSFEESPQDLQEEAREIGQDFSKLSVEFNRFPPYDYQDIMRQMKDTLTKKKIKVAVLDTVSTLSSFSESYVSLISQEFGMTKDMRITGEAAIKAMLYDLASVFKEAGVTGLWLSELPKEFLYYSRDTESEFLADGIILLNRVSVGQSSIRLLTIEKMRKTHHSMERFVLDISSKGLNVKSQKENILASVR